MLIFILLLFVLGSGLVFWGAYLIFQPAAYVLLGCELVFCAAKMKQHLEE